MTEKLIGEGDKYVIVQFSGATEIITAAQAELITKGMATGAKGFKTKSGNWMAFASISDIMSLGEYNTKYPDKALGRPKYSLDEKGKDYFNPDEEVRPLTQEELGRMRSGILKGLRQYIEEQRAIGIEPKNAIAIYNSRLEKLYHPSQIANLLY